MKAHHEKNMSIASRKKSFSYAINGVIVLIKAEPNAKLHAVATIVAIGAGIVRHIGPWQWIALFIAIGMVWITEAMNTCIEKLCNFCCDNQFHPAIKIIKDISAAAVLIAALLSIAIAIAVFFF